MRKYQIRTEEDLDAFRAAVAEAGERYAKWREFCAVSNTTMLANAANPDAVTFGLSALQVAAEGMDAAMQRFEAHALHFLGEPRKAGEDPNDYLVRLFDLMGDSPGQLRAMMARRGLKLKLN